MGAGGLGVRKHGERQRDWHQPQVYRHISTCGFQMHGQEPFVLKVLPYTEIVTAESPPSQGFPPEQGVCWGWGRESKTRHEQWVLKPVTGTCDPFYAECMRKVFHNKIFEVVKHGGWTLMVAGCQMVIGPQGQVSPSCPA